MNISDVFKVQKCTMFTLTTATSSLIYSKIKSEQGKQRSKQLDNLIVDKEVRMVKMTHGVKIG